MDDREEGPYSASSPLPIPSHKTKLQQLWWGTVRTPGPGIKPRGNLQTRERGYLPNSAPLPYEQSTICYQHQRPKWDESLPCTVSTEPVTIYENKLRSVSLQTHHEDNLFLVHSTLHTHTHTYPHTLQIQGEILEISRIVAVWRGKNAHGCCQWDFSL